MKKIKGWKTGIFFGLTLIVGIANLVGFTEFALTQDQSEWLAVVLPLIGLLLRTISDSEAGWLRRKQ